MGAVMLTNTEIMEHLTLEMFDSFIKDSEEAMADNPVPDRECDLSSLALSMDVVSHSLVF